MYNTNVMNNPYRIIPSSNKQSNEDLLTDAGTKALRLDEKIQ